MLQPRALQGDELGVPCPPVFFSLSVIGLQGCIACHDLDGKASYEGFLKASFHPVHMLYVTLIRRSFCVAVQGCLKAPWGIWFVFAGMEHVSQCGLSRRPSVREKGCYDLFRSHVGALKMSL